MKNKIIYWIPYYGLYRGIKIKIPFENNIVSIMCFTWQMFWVYEIAFIIFILIK
jgi:hypothetical protein